MSDEDARPGDFPANPSLQVLYERPGLPAFGLPEGLARDYGGDLGFAVPRTFANFVASVDGVVALPGDRESGQIISGGVAADRLVMGLLRACADAVLLGAGTFRKAAGHPRAARSSEGRERTQAPLWTAEAIYPAGAALFAELRARRGQPARPTLVLFTGSGEVDTSQPALEGAVIVTTPAGEAALRARAPASARLIVSGPDRIALPTVVGRLRDEGARWLLCEGGPSLLAGLVAENLLDELFLTSAPKIFGRTTDDHRKSLAVGADLGGTRLDLLSIRRNGSHLFLRYGLATSDGPR